MESENAIENEVESNDNQTEVVTMTILLNLSNQPIKAKTHNYALRSLGPVVGIFKRCFSPPLLLITRLLILRLLLLD